MRTIVAQQFLHLNSLYRSILAHIILISGGCRSGKSKQAEELALSLPGPHIYLATSPRLDDDMNDRIKRHQQQRAGKGWLSIEEELNIEKVLKHHGSSTILVDCLTLWINNLMWQAEQSGKEINEAQIAETCESLIQICKQLSGTLIFVSNETGMGIMPANRQARLFGDLSGRCNQIIAKAADKVIFMVSGIPMHIK